MKCPHCKQEIEEGALYCPFCGEEIPQLKSCPKTDCDNYGKVLPANYRFCPKCRTILINCNSCENISEFIGAGSNFETNDLRDEDVAMEEFCQKNDKGERTLTDNSKILFITAEKVKNRFKIGAYSIADNIPIFEDVFEKSQIQIESEDGHDALYIKTNYHPEKWTKITADGQVFSGLEWEQTSMCDFEPLFDKEEFRKRFPNCIEVQSIGYLKKEKSHVVLMGNDSNVEVRTSKGRLLFKLGNPYDLQAIPRDITSSGFIIVEDRDEHVGLWDMQGKEIIPCIYKEIKEVKEKKYNTTDYLELEDEDYNTYLYNVKTNEKLSEMTKCNYFKSYHEDEIEFMDVFDATSKQIVLKHICYNSGMTRELPDGWYKIHEWKERDGYMNTLSYILVRGSKHFRMPSKGELLEEIFSHGSTPDERYFISENRMITYMEKEDGGNEFCPDNISFFNIRDYDGTIISTKNNPTIWPLHPYHHGKVLAFKMKGDEVQNLVYLDLQGKEHYIPNTNHCYIGKPYKVAYEGKCTFVSEESFIIDCSDDERNFKLMDINGRVLIEKAWDLKELTDGYLLYSKDYDKVGVVDAHGFEVLRPIYDGVTILRETSVMDDYQTFRLLH